MLKQKIRGSIMTLLYFMIAMMIGQNTFAYSVAKQCLAPDHSSKLENNLRAIFDARLKSVLSQLSQSEFEKAGQASDDISQINYDPIAALKCAGFDKVTLDSKLSNSLKLKAARNLFAAFNLLDSDLLPVQLGYQGNLPELFYWLVKPDIHILEVVRSYFTQVAGVANYAGTQQYIQYSAIVLTSPGMAGIGNYIESCGTMVGNFTLALHEYAHQLDAAISGFNFMLRFSNTNQWKPLAQSEFVSFYGTKNVVEDFAESFSAYMNDPLFKCYAPQKYEVFSSFIKVNSEIFGSNKPFESLNCNLSQVQAELKIRAGRIQKSLDRCKLKYSN